MVPDNKLTDRIHKIADRILVGKTAEFINNVVSEGIKLGKYCNNYYNIPDLSSDYDIFCEMFADLRVGSINDKFYVYESALQILPEQIDKKGEEFKWVIVVAIVVCISLHIENDDYSSFLKQYLFHLIGYENIPLFDEIWQEPYNMNTPDQADAKEEIRFLKKRTKELEEELSTIMQNHNSNTTLPITCGPYRIKKGKKTAFMSVIWVLKEMGYFEKINDGSYATNRQDVIQQLIEGSCNTEQLLPKALRGDKFLEVFREMFEKANKLYVPGVT